MNQFYTTFATDASAINQYYVQGAKLVVSTPEQQKTTKENYQNLLISGEHKIFRSDGQKVGDTISAHCSGYVKVNDEEYYQINEMIIYYPNTKPYTIVYHSINVTPMDPLPKPPPEEIKKETEEKPKAPEKKPDEQKDKKEPEKHSPQIIDNPTQLIKSRTVLVSNLPYEEEQTDIIPEFEKYGKITRVAKTKGKILIEFENPTSQFQAIRGGKFKWRSRFVYPKKMENGFD
ncbi:hypothetical protein GPJ56_009501 [Histomonas meleagridis]|uniref:uncharacterized protein n=1 Tax=Histomonas meleagridis TaxID=135588 RepID=UPI003559EFFB|nr:hypothetical protein GPJ56_009501 [Histomonas meleagridis]KAH0804642.1 hypothetical protein GO595_002578 [Histomonas meleagridis]